MEMVAPTSTADNRRFSARAAGEEDDWAFWIPRAWHAVADQDGSHPPPERPIAMGGSGHGRVLDESGGLVAWWGPFTHLVICGLGWPNPTLGIARWQKMNSPTADPILAVIERWWGPYLQPFLNWSRVSYHFVNFLNTINADLGGAELAAAPLPDYDDFSNPDVDVRWFGPDGDNMHLTAHLKALNIDPRANMELLKRKKRSRTTQSGGPPVRSLPGLVCPAIEPQATPDGAWPWLAS